jgi:hypothetical protein
MIDQEELEKAYATTRSVGLSVCGGIFLYGVIAYVVNKQGFLSEIPSHLSLVLRYSFFGVSVLCLIAIRAVRKFYLEKESLEDFPSTPEECLLKNIKKLQASSMVTFGLCEVPALLGFVLSVMSHRMGDFYPFLAISWLGFIFYFPKLKDWVSWIESR